MAVTYGFFDSINHDRTYNAEELSRYFEGIVGNGVLKGIGNQLSISTENTTVKLESGRAIIDCRWYNQDSPIVFTVNAAATTRIDTLVLKVDYNTRKISAILSQGTSQSPPVLIESKYVKFFRLRISL